MKDAKAQGSRGRVWVALTVATASLLVVASVSFVLGRETRLPAEAPVFALSVVPDVVRVLHEHKFPTAPKVDPEAWKNEADEVAGRAIENAGLIPHVDLQDSQDGNSVQSPPAGNLSPRGTAVDVTLTIGDFVGSQ